MLPLRSAAGGGCGMTSWQCRTTLYKESSKSSRGGGSLWLSSRLLSLQTGAQLLADGEEGGFVSIGADVYAASGGGAGGQVIISVEELRLHCTDCGSLLVSARGGDANCRRGTPVGGAGGGGFVGIWWKGTQEDTAKYSDVERVSCFWTWRGGSSHQPAPTSCLKPCTAA
ncbi:unnamed protein product [Effrenium voratum]|nr:unnamed protein product [Effrenium voratum]